MSLMKNDNVRIDKLRAYYLGELSEDDPLTEKDQEVLARWKRAEFLYNRYRERPKVVNWLCKEFGISPRSAQQDITNALDFFGTLLRFEKPYHLTLLVEDGFKVLEQMKEDRDWRAYTSMHKTLHDQVKNFPDVDLSQRKLRSISIGQWEDQLPKLPANFDKELLALKKKLNINIIIKPDADAEFEEDPGSDSEEDLPE